MARRLPWFSLLISHELALVLLTSIFFCPNLSASPECSVHLLGLWKSNRPVRNAVHIHGTNQTLKGWMFGIDIAKRSWKTWTDSQRPQEIAYFSSKQGQSDVVPGVVGPQRFAGRGSCSLFFWPLAYFLPFGVAVSACGATKPPAESSKESWSLWLKREPRRPLRFQARQSKKLPRAQTFQLSQPQIKTKN